MGRLRPEPSAARGRLAWCAVALLLIASALAGWALPRESIDWQPALALAEPWRAFSAVGVHYSAQHLALNLAGAALAGLFGTVARMPPRLAWAWLAAWPLTQFGLLLKPELAQYGGLSGVLHAGVAVVVVFLLIAGTRAQRAVGAAVLIGLVAKLLGEAPWGDALRHPAGWDIAIAPLAHATGAVAGAVCAALACGLPPRRSASPPDARHEGDPA
jgi:rhomboid family GlyGly-CTERM serine protease